MVIVRLRCSLAAAVGVVALSCFSATALVPPPRLHASPSARPHSAGASSSARFGAGVDVGVGAGVGAGVGVGTATRASPRTLLAAATVPAAEAEAKGKANAATPPFSVSSTGVTSQVTFSGCGGLYCYFFGAAAYIQRHYNTSGTVFAGASAGTFPGTPGARSLLAANHVPHHHRRCCPRNTALLLAGNIDVLNFTSTQLGLLRDAATTWRGSPLLVWNNMCHRHMLDFLDSVYGPEAYKMVGDRFYVSMSDMTDWSPTIPIPTLGARGLTDQTAAAAAADGPANGGNAVAAAKEEAKKMTNLLVNEFTSNRFVRQQTTMSERLLVPLLALARLTPPPTDSDSHSILTLIPARPCGGLPRPNSQGPGRRYARVCAHTHLWARHYRELPRSVNHGRWAD